MFEGYSPEKRQSTSAELTAKFKDLNKESSETEDLFIHLEHQLLEHGFELADHNEVLRVFNNSSLMCRSESFSRSLELLAENEPIAISSEKRRANSCNMAFGEGFRSAMTEGFAGRDVGWNLKVVLTFDPLHITQRETIPSTDDIWKTKPKTAENSVVASGQILPEDLKMISFRFPTAIFPERLLTQEERDRIEDAGIHFIVRHYIRLKENTTHS